MKIIKYQIVQSTVNHGTEENPNLEVILLPKERCSDEANLERNIAIVKKEAYRGEYTVEDDDQETPEAPATLETRVTTLETDTADMAEALDMILSGVPE